jgi:hypothetical protein
MVFLYDRTEMEAATALGYRSGEGLKKRHLKGDLPDYLYVKFGYRKEFKPPEPPKPERVTSGDTLLEIGKTATYFHN